MDQVRTAIASPEPERPAAQTVTSNVTVTGSSTFVYRTPPGPITLPGVVTETMHAGDVGQLVIDPHTGQATIRLLR